MYFKFKPVAESLLTTGEAFINVGLVVEDMNVEFKKAVSMATVEEIVLISDNMSVISSLNYRDSIPGEIMQQQATFSNSKEYGLVFTPSNKLVSVTGIGDTRLCPLRGISAEGMKPLTPLELLNERSKAHLEINEIVDSILDRNAKGE